MDKPRQPAETSIDLTAADARAFAAANSQPDSSATPADQDNPALRAVKLRQMSSAAAAKPRPNHLIVGVAAVVILMIIAALALIPRHQNGTSAGAPLVVPTPASQDTNGLDNQTKQTLKSCSNVAYAALGGC